MYIIPHSNLGRFYTNTLYRWVNYLLLVNIVELEQIILFSDLLLHIPNSNLTPGNLTLGNSDLRPFFDNTEVIITGNPRVVGSPIGNGIWLINGDRIAYKFPVSEPWPCPFYINQCLTGIMLSFWFRGDDVISNYYRIYISLGNSFLVYRPHTHTLSQLNLRWNVDNQFSWYSSVNIKPDQWHLITWIVNHTNSVVYKDGLKYSTRTKGPYGGRPERKSNTLHMNEHLNTGNFSVGPMQLWSGRKSPVYIWRLFQEGLSGYDGNWCLLTSTFLRGHVWL